jgi:valyl-tRNA synthetase
MAMLVIHFTGEVPVRAVYLHSLVRTSSGEKMSKSKGTGLDPVALNEQYGTDAMRFCLASMAAPGTDIVLSDDRLLGARAFANKIWNAARFIFFNLDKFEQGGNSIEELAAPSIRQLAPYRHKGEIPLADEWLFGRLDAVAGRIKTALDNYRFHEAAQDVYHFFWGDFCDWYIEWVKPELQNENRERAVVASKNLFAAFDRSLRLLHPFMPFITEELWHQLPQNAGDRSIALMEYPISDSSKPVSSRVNEFGTVQDIIGFIRNIRSEEKRDPKKKIAAELYSSFDEIRQQTHRNKEGIERLGLLSELRITDQKFQSDAGGVRSTSLFDVRVLDAPETIDVAAELGRLKKEIEGLEKAIASKEKQLGNETFRSRAPEKVVREMEEVLAGQRVELGKMVTRKAQLEG